MIKTSRLLVAVLVVFGCFCYQHHALAQTNEQANDQSSDRADDKADEKTDDQTDDQADDQADDQTEDQTVFMMSNEAPTVTLTATLHPIIIENVWFIGLQAVSESDVLKAFRDQRVGIGKDYLYSAANFEKGVKVIKGLLDTLGYVDSIVEVRVDETSVRTRGVKFTVTEGAPYFVKEIQFEGNGVFTGDELRSKLKLVTTSGREVLNRSLFEYDLNNVRNFMLSRGYLQARTAEPKYVTADGGVRIIVSIDEGRLFRIGEIAVKGPERIGPDQILGIIGLKKGDIADGRRLSDALFEDLKSLYGNLGYPKYSAEPNPEYYDNPDVENEGILNVEITISEGRSFTIGSIEILTNKNLVSQELRRFLLFKEGDTYNLQLIEDSIRGLNESGLVRPIEIGADVDEQFDEETGQVDIVIRVQSLQDY